MRDPDAALELRRENDELRSEVLRLREALTLSDAKRATAERELRDAREDEAAAVSKPLPPAPRNQTAEPAWKLAAAALWRRTRRDGDRSTGHDPSRPDLARRLARFQKRLGAISGRAEAPDRQARVRRESFVARGDLERRRAALDLRLRFRPSDEDLRRANICHFYRAWHL